MEKLKQYKYIILVGLLLLGFVFYWTEIRPYLVKKSCFEEALPAHYNPTDDDLRSNLGRWRAESDEVYALCLKRDGI